MGRRIMRIGYWWEGKRDRDHWEDQDEGGLIILIWILERYVGGVVWTGFV
jgi:hypothetical protein